MVPVQRAGDPVNPPPASAASSSTQNAPGRAHVAGSNVGTGATPGSRTGSGTGISGAVSNTASISTPQQLEEHHLFMIVRRGSSFPVADMEVRNWDDAVLFKQLKCNYKELRGGLRQWLSWWRYDYSEFFRVSSCSCSLGMQGSVKVGCIADKVVVPKIRREGICA